MNFYVIGYPVRLIVGLAVLGATITLVPGVTRSLSERVIQIALDLASAFR